MRPLPPYHPHPADTCNTSHVFIGAKRCRSIAAVDLLFQVRELSCVAGAGAEEEDGRAGAAGDGGVVVMVVMVIVMVMVMVMVVVMEIECVVQAAAACNERDAVKQQLEEARAQAAANAG